MSKSFIYKILVVIALMLFTAAAVYAAVSEKGTVKGTTFKVASSFDGTGGTTTPTANTSLKLLNSLTQGTSDNNLVDSVNGPNYQDITPVWFAYYPVRIYNKSDETLNLVASTDYIADVNTIRDDLFVAIYEWKDLNNNGAYNDGEEGNLFKRDTILRLKNDTFNLGQIVGKGTKNLVLKFDGEGLSEANYSAEGVFDFVFLGTSVAP